MNSLVRGGGDWRGEFLPGPRYIVVTGVIALPAVGVDDQENESGVIAPV